MSDRKETEVKVPELPGDLAALFEVIAAFGDHGEMIYLAAGLEDQKTANKVIEVISQSFEIKPNDVREAFQKAVHDENLQALDFLLSKYQEDDACNMRLDRKPSSAAESLCAVGTPLHLAVYLGQLSVVALLLAHKHGVNPTILSQGPGGYGGKFAHQCIREEQEGSSGEPVLNAESLQAAQFVVQHIVKHYTPGRVVEIIGEKLTKRCAPKEPSGP